MSHEIQDDALVLTPGDVRNLPGTLSGARHLSLALVSVDASASTAVLELRDPEAESDYMVGELIEENEVQVAKTNRWRSRLHLPEKPLPVDTFTKLVVRLDCEVGQKLEIGDRVWAVASISAGRVVLVPSSDHEPSSVVGAVDDVGDSAVGTVVENVANTLNDAF